MTTFKEDGGSCTAQACWNPTSGSAEVKVKYSVYDWKERLPCPQIPVEGRPDLLVRCGLGATFGQEEYWGVNPVTGIPVIDYGAVFGKFSAGLIEQTSHKALRSRMKLPDTSQRSYRITRGGEDVVDEHWLDVGNDFSATFVFSLEPASERLLGATPNHVRVEPQIRKDPWEGAFDDFWD